MDYNRRVGELTCLAFIDESEPYEVDMNGIYTDGDKFYIISASGCSCWDGEYEESAYDSFEELKDALNTDDVSSYNPSLKGIEILIKEAESNLSNTAGTTNSY
jgi:hypothetical protein